MVGHDQNVTTDSTHDILFVILIKKYKFNTSKNFVNRVECQFQIRRFNKVKENIKRINQSSIRFLDNIGIKQWTEAYNRVFKYEWMMTILVLSNGLKHMIECLSMGG